MHTAPELLALDEPMIEPELLSINALMREINLRQRPVPELRSMMRILDKKRQARGLGWSRPWNKIGMTIFRTHRHLPGDESAGLRGAIETVRNYAPEPLLSRPFIDELFADPACVAYTFYHDREAGGASYEGLTVSFGRHAPDDRTKRDRIDLILEDRRVEGRVDGCVDLVRIIVCPWSSYGVDRDHFRHEQCEFSDAERAHFDALYRSGVGRYVAWKDDKVREWNHWSTAYIPYFGSRLSIPVGTSFG